MLDEYVLKRMILLFEKRTLKNQEMRIKFADAPEKYVFSAHKTRASRWKPFLSWISPHTFFFLLLCRFMESEIELHEAIQELHAIATVPDLYPILVQLEAITSLLDLLSHENTDISVAVVDLLQVCVT